MKKLLLATALILFLISIISVSADISASLNVKDESTGIEISGTTVEMPPYVMANVSGYYEDPTHGLDASASLTVWFKGPSDTGYTIKSILFSGTVTSGSTTTRDYELTEIGTYKFKWQVENEIDEAYVTTSVNTHVIPEAPIGTLLGIIAPIMALTSFIGVKRFRMRRPI